ncbi:MAG TPA: class I SAM-dependent methyltransferase [Candidatus Dormibacteraeota bacterium]|nr:class I SAM-dependent methyltransferase [Candidatus Dormibacteraeota bacterium]
MAPSRHPLFARYFERVGSRAEDRGLADHRRAMLEGLTGRALEIGSGTGLNFDKYPDGVDEVIAVEPEPYLRSRSAEAAGRTSTTIRIVAAVGEALPFPDSTFDAAVVCGVLCSVPHVETTLAELRRVLRPGGEIRFFEHVRSEGAVRGSVQDGLDLIWPRLMGGCHTNRRTLAAIRGGGYRIESCRSFLFPTGAMLSPVAPRILGIARRVDPDGNDGDRSPTG